MIKSPSWCKGAVPSIKGWHHPKTNELLKAQGLTHKQVSDWKDAKNGIGNKHDVAEVVIAHEEVVEEFFDEEDEEEIEDEDE